MPFDEVFYGGVGNTNEENCHDSNETDKNDPLCVPQPLMCRHVGCVNRVGELLSRQIDAGDDGDPLDPIENDFKDDVVKFTCCLCGEASAECAEEPFGDPPERDRSKKDQ